MQRYVELLVEDLRKSAAGAPVDNDIITPENEDEAFQNHIDDVERYLHGPQQPLSGIVGIPVSALPPPEKLNEGQIKIIVPELIRMLNAWNFDPDFPDNLPYLLQYKSLRDTWDTKFVYMPSGTTHIEFCDYDENNCPFQGYCKLCLEVGAEIFPDDETGMEAEDALSPNQNIHDHFDHLTKAEIHDAIEDIDPEGFIPGIHNYCDRWCERCDFTDRCRVFEMEKDFERMFESGDSNALENELPQIEDEIDDIPPIEFDMDKADLAEEDDDFFSAQSKAERHPLVILADKYSWNAHDWLKEQHKVMEENFTRRLAQGFTDNILECINIVGWYHFFIYTKLQRATNGFFEMDEFEDAGYDMNGSAKVALIAIDRSLEAYLQLRIFLKDQLPKISEFQKQLEKLRYQAEELFPEARAFIRPGLDEI
nr:hypothetical protein [Bacteroidota bacterium]